IGGLTNLTDHVVCDVLRSLAESCAAFNDPDGVVLLAVAGKESETSPRLNRLMHEKLLFAEALREGLARRFGACQATSVPRLRQHAGRADRDTPAVAIGYIKELLHGMRA